jgi:hypothetical protein
MTWLLTDLTLALVTPYRACARAIRLYGGVPPDASETERRCSECAIAKKDEAMKLRMVLAAVPTAAGRLSARTVDSRKREPAQHHTLKTARPGRAPNGAGGFPKWARLVVSGRHRGADFRRFRKIFFARGRGVDFRTLTNVANGH